MCLTINAFAVQSLSHVQLWSCGLQHTRLPRLSLFPRVCSDSRPLSQWCYATISSSAAPLSFGLQAFPASGSFPLSQLFELGGQSTGTSASVSVLPMNTQGWFPLGLIDWLIDWSVLKCPDSKNFSKKLPLAWNLALDYFKDAQTLS